MIDILTGMSRFADFKTLKELMLVNKTCRKSILTKRNIKLIKYFNKIGFDLDYISFCKEVDNPEIKVEKFLFILNQIINQEQVTINKLKTRDITENNIYTYRDVKVIATLIYNNQDIVEVIPEIKDVLYELITGICCHFESFSVVLDYDMSFIESMIHHYKIDIYFLEKLTRLENKNIISKDVYMTYLSMKPESCNNSDIDMCWYRLMVELSYLVDLNDYLDLNDY